MRREKLKGTLMRKISTRLRITQVGVFGCLLVRLVSLNTEQLYTKPIRKVTQSPFYWVPMEIHSTTNLKLSIASTNLRNYIGGRTIQNTIFELKIFTSL